MKRPATDDEDAPLFQYEQVEHEHVYRNNHFRATIDNRAFDIRHRLNDLDVLKHEKELTELFAKIVEPGLHIGKDDDFLNIDLYSEVLTKYSNHLFRLW